MKPSKRPMKAKGDPIPLSTVAAHAAANGIALRTGCMCNPGGAATLLSLGSLMAILGNDDPKHPSTLRALEEAAGRELGVVRISFGLASCWTDVWRVRCWVVQALDEEWVVKPPVPPVWPYHCADFDTELDGVVGAN
jgi:selenocysteine lyase/cysteine desulfurase